MSNKKLGINEFKQKLAKGLQERVEAFSQKCAELAALEKATGTELVKADKAEEDKKPEDKKDEDGFSVAWKQYKERKSKTIAKKEGFDKEKYPSIADSYEDGTDQAHPKKGDKTVQAKKLKKDEALDKAAMCKACGKDKELCKCMAKDVDYVDDKTSNIPDKQLVRVGGKETVLPSDKPVKVDPAPGSGGERKDLKKDDLQPGHAFNLTPIDHKPAPSKATGKVGGGELKPGTEFNLQPVGDLAAPSAAKTGPVQRIHQAAKAKMGAKG